MALNKRIDDILATLSRQKKSLYLKYPIQSMAVFGSYARKEESSASDLDILVEFSGNIGIRFIDLADELESITGIKVDLVSRKGIREKYFNALRKDLIYV